MPLYVILYNVVDDKYSTIWVITSHPESVSESMVSQTCKHVKYFN